MSETSERTAPLAKRGLPDRDLGILLNVLHRLHHQIKALLWRTWMDKHRPGEAPRAEVAIATRMRAHLEQAAAEAARAAEEENGESATTHRARGRTPRRKSETKHNVLMATEFSRHLQRTGGGRILEPRLLGERMQKSTLEHINQALGLARAGDTAGAKLHAGLAENAMKTAAHHMSPAGFAAFSATVEERLRALEEVR